MFRVRIKFSLWLQQRKYLISFLSLVKVFFLSLFFSRQLIPTFAFLSDAFPENFISPEEKLTLVSCFFLGFLYLFFFFSADNPQNSLLLPTSRKLEWSNFLLSLTQKGRNTFRTNLQHKKLIKNFLVDVVVENQENIFLESSASDPVEHDVNCWRFSCCSSCLLLPKLLFVCWLSDKVCTDWSSGSPRLDETTDETCEDKVEVDYNLRSRVVQFIKFFHKIHKTQFSREKRDVKTLSSIIKYNLWMKSSHLSRGRKFLKISIDSKKTRNLKEKIWDLFEHADVILDDIEQQRNVKDEN